MIQPNYWGVVMLFKVLSSALLATVLLTTGLQAQSLASIGGPVNFPPAGFTGQQFVDNRGCLFLRAGFGNSVNWVPRVDRARKPLCGMTPTFGAAVVAAVEADMASEPPMAAAAPVRAAAAPVTAAPVTAARTATVVVARPVVAAAPKQAQVAAPAPRRGSFLAMLFGTPNRTRVVTPAPQVVAAPAPLVVAAPAQPAYQASDLAGPSSGQIQCYTSAPRLERVLLRSGGTALVCTTGNGSLTGWRPPRFPAGAGVGAALTARAMAGATVMGSARTTAAAAANAIPTPPAGYKSAWTDDRLNPLRGVGTAQGQAQQDQLWTREVPARLVADQPRPRATARVATATVIAPTVTVSTMSAPEASNRASYVQVGTFGQPANADGVKARLAALGLPVSTSKITRSGKVLQVVYAGPFGSAAEAQAALTATRNAGFSDAILR